MTIALFAGSFQGGGAEHVAAQLTHLWSRLGHRVVVLSPTAASEQDYEASCCIRLQISMRDITRAVVDELKLKYGVSVLVINGLWNNEGYWLMIEAIKASQGVKVIQILHHPFSNWLFTLSCTREFGHRSRAKSLDLIAAVDPLTALWWHRLGAKSIWLPNPVIYAPASSNEYRPSKRIVWIGRCDDPVKRIEFMLDIFRGVLQRHPDAELHILGKIQSSHRKRLVKSVDETTLRRVVFHGYVKDVPLRLAMSGLHVSTGLAEASPLVIGEAQSFGVPTVLTDLPVLHHLNEGVGVVRAVDRQDFIEKISSLLGSFDRLNKLSRLAYDCAVRASENDPAVKMWDELLSHCHDEMFDARVRALSCRLETQDNYDALIRDMYEGSAYFICRHLPDLRAFRKIKMQWNLKYAIGRLANKGLRVLKGMGLS